jgi:ATP-dependent helicase/nuclease subunit A
VLAAEAQHAAWQHHQRMARLTRLLIESFAELKRERGWVDMNDVERAALTLLSDPFLSGWVQERLDARVRHLLIDEFQDTNPLQWQALHAWLSGYAGAGGGTSAPSVFIVGDPKQSIYRFRRADPQVFIAAQAFIVNALGGDLLACDHTHRNAPKCLGAVNTVMLAGAGRRRVQRLSRHTTESTARGHVRRLPLIPRPDRRKATPRAPNPPWRDSLTTPRVAAEDSLRTLESRQAARWVAAQIEAGTPPKEIMVLARQRNRLSPLQDELRAAGHRHRAARKSRPGRSARSAGPGGPAGRAGLARARPVAGARAQVAAVRRQRCRPDRAGPAAPRGSPPGPPLAGTAAGRG